MTGLVNEAVDIVYPVFFAKIIQHSITMNVSDEK